MAFHAGRRVCSKNVQNVPGVCRIRAASVPLRTVPGSTMATAEERVPLSELSDLIRVGEPLPFRVLDAQARLLLNEGQVLLGEAQREMLIERGAWAERVRVVAERDRRAAAAGGASAVPSGQRRRTLFDAWEQCVWDLDALLRQAGRHAGVGAALAAFVQAQIALVDRDPDIALFMAVRQDDRRFALYALTHGLHTATVALLAARALGWSPAQQASLVGAALTMNVSILELQAHMAEQDTPPTQKQLEQIRSHPLRSLKLLRDAGVDDAAWLEAVLDHHEHRDGSGYPRGRRDPGELPLLLRAADVFMAKISPRALRPPLLPQVAARQLFQQEAGGPVAAALIKSLGIYPPGDLVQLRSGEAAVVTHRGSTGAAPRVAAISDARGRPVAGTTPRDTSDPAWAITGALAERTAFTRVLPERVYGLVLA